MGFQNKNISSRSEKVDFVESYGFLRQCHLNDFKNVKKELDECNNKIDEILQENENLKNENKQLQGDLDILHNFNDSLMRFGCVREFVNNNINIMEDLQD